MSLALPVAVAPALQIVIANENHIFCYCGKMRLLNGFWVKPNKTPHAAEPNRRQKVNIATETTVCMSLSVWKRNGLCGHPWHGVGAYVMCIHCATTSICQPPAGKLRRPTRRLTVAQPELYQWWLFKVHLRAPVIRLEPSSAPHIHTDRQLHYNGNSCRRSV